MAYPPLQRALYRQSALSPLLARAAAPSKTSGGFKPAFKPAFGAAASPAAPTYSSAPSYASAPAANYGASYPSYPQHSSPAVGGAGPYQAPTSSYNQYPQAGAGYGQATSYNAAPSTYGAAPQIRNPFPLPGRDEQRRRQRLRRPRHSGDRQLRSPPSAVPDPAAVAAAAAAANQPPERKKTVVREGGGKKWTDDSLAEWDPSHLRLFVGNLAGEVTDESLLKAFARWKSVQKARVIRDKRTAKSKGYGFVSFSDADDFFQAAKEMNGKYIQSHPVTVRKANTEIKITNVKDKDHHNNRKNKNKKHAGNGGGGGGNKHAGDGTGYEPHLGPVHSHGVTKPGQKTKNGLKLLG
ncbi:LOW QUALITY PROTEIN: RNP domain-containing protein [Colletotrichum tofieldiae]|nr:LOW QUALITY PROTEIN: RNP domain-containing protein [Colletotrichum tofieldiae]